jgi:hypothetical protein
MFKFLASAVLAFFIVQPASATIIFGPSVSYSTRKQSDASAGTIYGCCQDRQVLTVDARLGYVFTENGLYLGGIYKLESDKYEAGDLSGFAVGPSIGYVNSGFSLIATYHLMAERRYTFSGLERRATSGSGLQVDLGWAPQVATNFGIGPVLTYRTLKFGKTQIGTAAETSQSAEETTLEPSLLFWFSF